MQGVWAGSNKEQYGATARSKRNEIATAGSKNNMYSLKITGNENSAELENVSVREK
jgi:hypothetical protein